MPDKAGTGERAAKPAREPWIIRTYAGFGDARQANRRFLSNLKEGQRGLSIAFDLPTQNGYDPDAPVAANEVGKAGVSICHWRDMETLFDGIPLDKINTSMTAAERGGVRADRAPQGLHRAVTEGGAMMEPTLELARAGGTVGEWAETIERATRGRYTPPILERNAGVGAFKVTPAKRRIRIALGKAGLDGHINAVKLLAHACMQAGMEAILAGFKQTPAQLVETALQEDADVLAISSLAGAHSTIAHEALEHLKKRGAANVKLVMGGIIPEHDRKRLGELGVKAVFTPKDSSLGTIVERIVAIAGEDKRE